MRIGITPKEDVASPLKMPRGKSRRLRLSGRENAMSWGVTDAGWNPRPTSFIGSRILRPRPLRDSV